MDKQLKGIELQFGQVINVPSKTFRLRFYCGSILKKEQRKGIAFQPIFSPYETKA